MTNSSANTRIGVDTGGTFTDFVHLANGQLRVHKQLSTPEAPEQAILDGLAILSADAQPGSRTQIIHGSTVATNAVLEGKGARVAYVTNRGFADVLSIGRQARAELYNLQPALLPPPVPRELCLETGGRLSAEGEWLEPLTSDDIDELLSQLGELKPQAVAINLLFSWLDSSAEEELEAAINHAFPNVLVCRSSAVLPELREYERGMATWLNAFVGPVVNRYLQRLLAGAAPANVTVMQSSGETIAAQQAAERGVNLLLSGPAGGLMAAQRIGELAGLPKLLTFDIGGTSTDVALINGQPQLTAEGQIDRYPVAVPMVDMHTIGAGGGSIASIDAAGALLVGPESAGAMPGPACYGRGNAALAQPTVTDANLLLGRLLADGFLGGGMQLDVAAAEQAIGKIAKNLGCDLLTAARGIVALADEHMAQALRVISVQRGENPADYALMSFGGAGGLHVCALAEALGMQRAIVPVHAGVLSALGMLAAPRGRQLSHSFPRLLVSASSNTAASQPIALLKDAEQQFTKMHTAGMAMLRREGVTDAVAEKRADVRYQGQGATLSCEWLGDMDAQIDDFHQRHASRYGHRLERSVEVVNLRLSLRSESAPLILSELPKANGVAATASRTTAVDGETSEIPVYERSKLLAQQQLKGPALITETVSTTWLARGWLATVDKYGNLLLENISKH